VRSRRLAAVAELVLPGQPVADVGTDHALLLAHLLDTGRVPRAIGIDLARAAVRSARLRHPALDLRAGDGLAPLQPGEAATVVIAGMGGLRVVAILQRGPLEGVRRLVLQPNRDVAELRRWLAGHGWDLDDERLVEERGHFYPVLAAGRARTTVAWDEADLRYGPLLRQRRDPALMRWLAEEQHRLVAALSALPEGHPDRAALTAELALATAERREGEQQGDPGAAGPW